MILVSFISLRQFHSVVFSQSGSVSGLVLDKQTNVPLGGVQVFFYEPTQNLLKSTTTNADGTFQAPVLPVGNLQVSVMVNGYAQSVQAELDLTEGQQITGIRIVLPKEAQLTGKVLSSTGQPILKAEVFAQRTDEKSSGFTTSASDGSFKVLGLDAGTYTVRVKSKGFLSAAIEGVILQSGQTAPLPDVQLQPAGRMTVDILDSSGQAFPDAEITVEGGEVFKTATSGQDGKAEFAELPFGDYTVAIDATGYILSTRSYSVTSFEPPTSVQVSLQKGASIVGHVYESDGMTPIAGANIIAFGTTENIFSGSTSIGGSYSLIGLPPDTYQINVSVSGRSISLSEGNVSLSGSGQRTVDFIFPMTGSVKGKVFLNDGITPVQGAVIAALQSDGEKAGNGVSEANTAGEYEIKGLIPGTYTIMASLGETRKAEIAQIAVTAGQITDHVDLILSVSQ